jgi:hypothetical protein
VALMRGGEWQMAKNMGTHKAGRPLTKTSKRTGEQYVVRYGRTQRQAAAILRQARG